MNAVVLSETHGKVGLIRINRPEAMNALNDAVADGIAAAVDAFEADENIGCMVLTGNEKAFAAGADISVMRQNSFDYMHAYKTDFVTRNWERIRSARKPVIAAVSGYALGGGCEFAMMCDMIYAAENAKFGQPEVNLGLIPGYGGTQRLTALVGKGKAMELCMTSHMADANEALTMGLVNHVTTQENLLERTKDILNIINTKSPMALSKVISAVNQAGTAKGFETEISLFGECFGTADMKEGVTAFMEKRKAVFTGE